MLLDAAVRVVEKDGVSALSLHALARKAGVTSGAPYHHFESREQLLAELAREGFRLLAAAMKQAAEEAEAAVGGGKAAAEAALRGLGIGYVRFALAHRGHFRLMFRPELKPELGRDEVVVREAFEMLTTTIERCQKAGVVPAGDVRPLVLLAWSAVHGASALWIDGTLADEGLVANGAALGSMIAGTLTGLFRDAARKP